MRRIFTFFFVFVLLIGAVIGGLFGRNSLKASSESQTQIEQVRSDYAEAVEIVTSNYAGNIEFEKATESSVQGMLYTLDPHSSFFTRAEFQKLSEDQSSRFYGIGVSIFQHRDGVYIQSIVADTPAARAGLRYGDKFLEVDGKDATQWTSQEVSKNVRGERGVPVKVKIERAGNKDPLEFTITRGGVPYPSIRNAFMIREGIGYIALVGGFQETTDDELGQAIKLLKAQGMKQLVLDLRGNPGGLLPQAINVSSRFIPKGEAILSVRGRSRYARPEDYPSNGNETQDFPLVVVINGGTASASEIVAGAVQDHGRGLIVGETSFGKGLVQRVFQLPGGTGLTLTTARYYTPFGRSLQRDYSNGSIYEYYTKHAAERDETKGTATPTPTPAGAPIKTAGGRVFYGGGGIAPDIEAKPLNFSPLRGRIAEAAFYFTRQIVNGQIAGLENMRIERQQFDHALRPTDFPVTDKVLDAFRAFLTKYEANGLKPENINGEIEFTKNRLREEMVTAAFSSELGQQVLLDVDPQVLKAIEVLPDSKNLPKVLRTTIAKQNDYLLGAFTSDWYCEMQHIVFTEIEFDDFGFQPRGRRSFKVSWSDIIRVAYGYKIHSVAVVDWNFWAFQTINPNLTLEFEIGSISTLRFSDEIERKFGNPNIPPMKDWINSNCNIKTFVIYPKEDFGKSLHKIEKRHYWSWREYLSFSQSATRKKKGSQRSV